MIIEMSKGELNTLQTLIDIYKISDYDDIRVIDAAARQYKDRENQENMLTKDQIKRLEIFERLIIYARNTYISKNIDYGDSFAKSYKEFGMIAPVVRMSDKIERLKSLVGKDPEVGDEGIKDTLMDLANYAFMTALELEEEERNAKDGFKEYEQPITGKVDWRTDGDRPYDHLFDMYMDEHEDYDQGDKLNI